jgi:sterol-4alpha-carboxylate 3-dehydrogenase (decarboxylating)
MESSSALLGSVLVLGGCGFLGHHIVKQVMLASDVAKVTVLDIDTSKNRIDGVDYISGSITSNHDVELAFKTAEPTVVFHTASPDPLSTDNTLFSAVNIDGTKIVICYAQASQSTKALVYTSSSSVIHDNWSALVKATEEAPVIFHPQQPVWYSHTKAVAETLVLSANCEKLRTAAIRPAGLFGEGDTMSITSIISNAREGKARMQIGDNSNSFDWTYVGNHAYAQMLAARALVRRYSGPPPAEDMRVDGEAFVITNDDPWKFWTFFRGVAAAAGYPTPEKDVIVVPWRLMMGIAWVLEWGYWIFTFGTQQPRITQARIKYTASERTLDIAKAKKRLGYRPRVSMQEGINRSAKWYIESHP